MKIRRVVTGRAADGSSIVVSDGLAPRSHDYIYSPGLGEALVWATEDGVRPGSDEDPSVSARSYVPGPRGTRLIMLRFPPDTIFGEPGFDPSAARAEQLAVSPGLADLFEAEAPGMHTTDTVDYGIVLGGELWLELDHGHATKLGPGDVVVQNGTRHAWRNRSQAPAFLAVVLIGTQH